MKTTNLKKVQDFFNGLNTEVDILNYIDIDDIDYLNAFESIYDMIDNKGGFNVDIIYYSKAIEFISENDPSLKDSLEIASDMGYKVSDINSELLASLLASENARNEIIGLREEINDFFQGLIEEEEE